MKARIWYADGTHHDGPPYPPTGVQVIVMPNPEGGIMTACKTDYYVLDKRAGDTDERWYGVDLFGLFDYLMESGLVLFGRTLSGKAFRNILETALRKGLDD